MEMATKETFKIKLEKLVEHFSNNEEFYKSKEYKEDHLRQEFLNPFFKALGWDMDNEAGYAPQYREVIPEDRIEIEGKPKAPDYAFKVGSERKFFVEAKASSVKVFSEIDPAFQLRRYAWSGQLPVSILSDFEEFSVYDTTIEPKHTDKASVARIKYLHYKDYLKEADYLWDTFSKDAVWKGSFDKFAKREKKGSQLVDKSFLKEIEQWRELIAKDIASNNNLNIYELNSVVQKFIDRIIFLRIAEDRGIENYETLRSKVKESNTYAELLKIFRRADDKYNSSLFDLQKDELSTKIKVSDKVLDKILSNLYYPKSPYEFSVIGVDILGSVYEQFLGKVIRLTRGGNAVIEEKPEVKKAGGVYYTPQYIVEYIVKNTVGELVKDKTPRQVRNVKIVDPACGSGSFLIGAYNYLLDWHLKYYTENEPEKHIKAKRLFKDSQGNYLLSTQEKKEILISNIYGVDIDQQAVEVTKLSLALKMLEDENSETIGSQFVMFADRILPDLSSNIKCGNSLIGSDYYSDKQISLLGDDEIRKVNAFDWDKEFPLVFRYGGFDAVIGNPPYVGMEEMDEALRSYTFGGLSYSTAVRKTNLYAIFIEKNCHLLKNNALLGLITPYSWITNSSYKELREMLFGNYSVNRFILLPYGIFENAGIATSILLLKNDSPREDFAIQVQDLSKLSVSEVSGSLFDVSKRPTNIPLRSILLNDQYIFNVNYNENVGAALRKIMADSVLLKKLVNIDRGCDTANNGKYTGTVKDSSLNPKRLIEGSDFGRWFVDYKDKYIYYLPEKMTKEKATARPGSSERFEQREKLVVYRFLNEKKQIVATYDNDSYYTLGSTYVISSSGDKDIISLKSVLAILNSNICRFYITQKFKGVKVTKNELGLIPINLTIRDEAKKIEDLVDLLLEISTKRKNIGFERKRILEAQLSKTEKELNSILYKCYSLSPQEILEIENFNY